MKISKEKVERLFTSPQLKNNMQAVAAMLTKRYGFELQVVVNLRNHGEDFTAFTDGDRITINCSLANPVFPDSPLPEERLEIIKGLFAHELGHVLFTNFSDMKKVRKAFNELGWFPYRPKNENGEDIINFLESNPDKKSAIISMFAQIDNIIEDGYIEDRFMSLFPGRMCEALYYVREIHFDSSSTIFDMQEMYDNANENEKSNIKLSNMLNLLLMFSKFGKFRFKFNDNRELKYDIVAEMNEVFLAANAAIAEKNDAKRAALKNEVFCTLWPVIKPIIEEMNSSSLSDVVEKIEKSSSEIGESSGKGKMSSMPDVDSEDSESKESREKTVKELSAPESGDAKNLSPSLSDKEDSSDTEEEDDKGTSSKDANGDEEIQDTSAEVDNLDSGVSDEKSDNQISDESTQERKTDNALESSSGSGSITEEDIDYDPLESSSADIMDILEEIDMDDKIQEEAEADIEKIRNEIGSINLGGKHAHTDVTVYRSSDINADLKSHYDDVAKPLTRISKKMAKMIAPKINNQKKGGKNKNLYFGRKLEARSLIRNDGKVFYKKNLPKDTDLAIAILVDESGSMNWEDRSAYARSSAIILHHFCEELDLPHCIYGHSADDNGGGSLELFSYVEFDRHDRNDKYRLMDIKARSNNRDGAAMKIMYEKLMARPERKKILIIISDGAPAASGYVGEPAEKEMRDMKKTYARKGVITFAAAIGSDKEEIKRIYEDGFLDISNLNRMPEVLTKLIIKQL